MKSEPKRPWRQRLKKLSDSPPTQPKNSEKTKLLKGVAWLVFCALVAYVFKDDGLNKLRALPASARFAYNDLRSWHYNDADWSGSWSSREEGSVEDFRQSDQPIHILLKVMHGEVTGEFFAASVCNISPMLLPGVIEGEINGGDLYARAYTFIGGEKRAIVTFQGTRSKSDPVLTLKPIGGEKWLLPSEARLLRSFNDRFPSDHPELSCKEGPREYLHRLKEEGKLRSVEELYKDSKRGKLVESNEK